MTRCQPARWKKVACGQASTKRSQRAASADPIRPTVTTGSLRLADIGRSQKNMVHAAPVEILRQPGQARLGPLQVDIVTEAGFQADAGLARLVRVQFPRVKVEYASLAIARIDAPQAPARNGVGQQPEIAAAAGRKVAAQQAHGADRQFQQAGRAGRTPGEAGRVGHAVVVVAYRVDAGTVAVARLQQDIERPQVGRTDREAGRAIAKHGLAADLFQQVLAEHDVAGVFVAALIAGAAVRVAVAGQLVAVGDDGAHDGRVAFGDPAQREEGGMDGGAVQQEQDAFDIALDPAWQGGPVVAGDVGGEGGDVEVVFDIDGQRVADSVHGAASAVGAIPIRSARVATPQTMRGTDIDAGAEDGMGWLSELDDKRGAGAIFTVIAAGVAVVAGVVQLDQRADLGPQLAVQSEAEHAVAVAPAGADGLDVADAGAQAEIAARRHAPAPAGVERVLAGPVVQADLAGAEQDAVDAAAGLGRAADSILLGP